MVVNSGVARGMYFGISKSFMISAASAELCPPHWGVDILFLLFPLSIVRRPPSGVRTLGFRLFEGKVFILSLPNLVWVFIGLIACMGLLLVKIGV